MRFPDRQGPPTTTADREKMGDRVGDWMNSLNNLTIKNATDGKLFDGGGLLLRKQDGKGKWVLRYTFPPKRRREMGLGTWPEVSLADARKERDKWRAVIREGLDPITERGKALCAVAAELSRHDPTFWDVVEMTLEAKRDGLRGQGERGRWLSPLRVHAKPKIGTRRISTLDTKDFVDMLRPMWRTKHPTAEKLHQRSKQVLEYGKLLGFDVDPDIVSRAVHILGEVNHQTKHLTALPWQDMPDLYASLGNLSPAHHVLRWLILTAVRWDAASGAQWGELDGDVWTVPKARIKGKEGKVQEFRVPVTEQMQTVLDSASQLRGVTKGDWVFAGRKAAITEAAVRKILDGRGTIHGIRTSFRMWVQDTGSGEWEVAETMLGHRVGTIVERSYARSDLLDRRRALMVKWGEFLTGQESRIVKLR